MRNFKKWWLSLVKNLKHHQRFDAELSQTKTELSQTKTELSQTKTELSQTKTELSQTKTELSQTKTELSQTKTTTRTTLDFHLRKITPMAFLELLEIHLAESCNLNCFGCNHFSQIAEESYTDIEEFEKDMRQLTKVTKGEVGVFRLMGGEPLLNPQCSNFFEVTRKYFPKSEIWLVSNGLLLEKQDALFWQRARENNVQIRPTKYPLKIDWDKIKALCDANEVPLIFFNEGEVEKTSWKFTLDPEGKCDNYHSFTHCSMANHCVQFKKGRLYTCTFPAHIEHYNKKYGHTFELSPFDSISIYEVKDYQELLYFLAKPIPFCRYCKVSQWAPVGKWRPSKKDKFEYLERKDNE
ncbi:4Fe-4S cluster-binding domain-containing protein [Campylobacter upsaliensis]|nr:4Fe-4S cluster-binding domain-containing protein [Campylobacter upsaliensis]EAJ8785808.1 4Fe-4S cluster-binding domain-containing protein [Campylobacter upsaliensis]EHK4961488.1 4Fe-4S cluster-binding domain-containing protein [Campylobacter upsaliensis]